ncbi:sigma-54-dependent transcriptional regulator [Pseudoblastomonas halimionae]|uniref:sigma-54-dependent transcriptional regulator n=1 Tax=Alteriqipengyuania halimionae TaxID=1926630 RepID=UPI002D7E9881|nr:response regulator [Alteriqipengyuania halimionae]
MSGNGQQGDASSEKTGFAILLIDDRPEVATAMEIAFRMAGHGLTVAHDPEEAFSQLARSRFDGIVLDLNFTPGKSDGEEGLACLERIIADDPAACVVVLTAHGGMRMAVAAMQAGARDFAVKPWNNADLIAKVEAAVAREPIAAPTTESTGRAGGERHTRPARILGESAAIENLRQLIRRVAPTMAGVAITGPSGAGRMVAARAVHAASADADNNTPLLIDLREGDAIKRVAEAEGSVILRYPDRLDDLTQDRLAAQLTERIRPIAITDRIDALTPALRRRIATIELPVPSLSQRRDDVCLLARHFITDAAERFGRPAPRLTDAAETVLREADWPDEVRGLAATMERAVLLSDDGMIDTGALSLSTPAAAASPDESGSATYDLDRTEKAMIAAALTEHHHNVSHAAKALGLSRGALYRRMERHGL